MRIELEHAISLDEVTMRLRRMSSILAAIETGELLASPPENPAARANHSVAVDLLALLHDEVRTLGAHFEGGRGSA